MVQENVSMNNNWWSRRLLNWGVEGAWGVGF